MGEEKSGRSHVLPLLAIGAITSACGIALGLTIHWFPTQASEAAPEIDTLYDVLLVVSVPIFVGVMAVVFAGFTLSHRAADLGFAGRRRLP